MKNFWNLAGVALIIFAFFGSLVLLKKSGGPPEGLEVMPVKEVVQQSQECKDAGMIPFNITYDNMTYHIECKTQETYEYLYGKKDK